MFRQALFLHLGGSRMKAGGEVVKTSSRPKTSE